MSTQQHPTTQLFVGSAEGLEPFMLSFLIQQWCPIKCLRCSLCLKIQQHQHPDIYWLAPEKGHYTRAHIEQLKKMTGFKRSIDEPFFCIIRQAHLLLSAAANSLLKLLEEASPGYYFILLTHKPTAVLPTIRSRCIVTELQDTSPAPLHQLVSHLTQPSLKQLAPFLKDLDAQKPTETDAQEIIESVMQSYASQAFNTPSAERALALLYALQKRPPMPGSAKIFLRNLYLILAQVA